MQSLEGIEQNEHSAAIIITFLKALNDFYSLKLSKRQIAHYATEIEHKQIGITAGPQDRFVITFEGTQFMDFSSKDPESYVIAPIDISDLPLYVGVRSKNISSGDVHKFPYEIYPQSPELQKIVVEITECAEKGKKAIKKKDIKELGLLMNRNQQMTQEYGQFDNPNETVILQREIDKEILEYCQKGEVIGAKLGGSSGSIIILSEEKPDFLLDFKISDLILMKIK